MPEPQRRVIRCIAVRVFSIIPLFLLAACDGGAPRNDAMASLNAGIAANEAAANRVEAVAADARPAPAPEAVAIPAAMLGRWTGVTDDCADPAAPMNLRVERSRLLFHESEGQVTAVEPRGDGAVLVDADFTGEGQSWTRRLTMIPQDGGQRLRIDGDGNGVTRKRCPA